MTRQRTNPDRTLTNVERCKRYRNKNVDVYARNKRYKRILASEDPFANKKRLEEQAEKKRLYRLRKKLTANGANQDHQLHQATSSTPELELSQPSNAASSTPASSTPTFINSNLINSSSNPRRNNSIFNSDIETFVIFQTQIYKSQKFKTC